MMEYDTKFLGHGNNITQKERIASSDNLKTICKEVRKRYSQWVSDINLDEVLEGDLDSTVESLNNYVNFVKTVEASNRFFNWRSDFAASVIPEFLYRVLAYKLSQRGIDALFSTRSSVVELTLSGSRAGGWDIRKKNQDLCIGLRREEIIASGTTERFVVPQIAFEVKTNIDINKLNGLDFSAERLKRTFPTAKYILVTETVDFSLKDNYAAGSIDEVYVLRKQVRSAARRRKEPIKADVIKHLVDDVEAIMAAANMDRGHVYDRLESGRLINA